MPTMDLHDLTAEVKAHGGANAGSVFIFNGPERNEQGLNIVSRQVCALNVNGEAGVRKY